MIFSAVWYNKGMEEETLTPNTNPDADEGAQFAVESKESLEWFMKRLFEAESELAKIEEQRKAINANLDTMANEWRAKAGRLRYLYSDQAAAVAKAYMPEGRKTYSCPYGKISFRMTSPRVLINDLEAAKRWARTACPSAIRVEEKLLVSAIPKDAIESAPGLAWSEPEERLFIDTGVLKEIEYGS